MLVIGIKFENKEELFFSLPMPNKEDNLLDFITNEIVENISIRNN